MFGRIFVLARPALATLNSETASETYIRGPSLLFRRIFMLARPALATLDDHAV